MSAPAERPFAWEPVTPRGVAAFAHADLSRLLLVQCIVALLTASSVAWFLHNTCYPSVLAAIRNMPADGVIRASRLDWRGDDRPQLLAEGNFIAFDVDKKHSGQIHSTADVQVEFGTDFIRVFSLLGYVDFPYPPEGASPFNRTELEPLWGAWAAEILFIAAMLAALALLSSWWLLATVYFLPAWLIGFFTNRNLNLRASWQLCGAALLPGALLMAAGIILYGMRMLDLVSFGLLFVAHIVLGWIYLFLSQPFLSQISGMPETGNPFMKK